MVDSQLDPDSDEYTVVRAMSESFYTLVQVRDVFPGVGVRVNDLFADREYLLIDMGLSQTAAKGLVLATRLIPFDDFVMTSGAALPIDSKEMFLKIINKLLPQYGSTDDEYISLDMKQRADLTAAIIRLCLENDMSSQIEYKDDFDEPVVSPTQRENRIGRNEPCPCGSGKKYKRCCGR
ncbi:MAG: SEC-C domain-containing protein [Sedimentisphaerales bacterium]|nr:SEC-C domain-containing protein [Sedimentisphaerales bacterium]